MKTKIIAIGNQKGGVGKTTTALNVGVALRSMGKNVLMIDLDPQGNLSTYLGYHPETDDDTTIYELIQAYIDDKEIDCVQGIKHNETDNIDYIPADISLSNAETLLVQAIAGQQVLKGVLSNEAFKEYDYIIIDCLPSIGLLFINAITAADGLIIPVAQKFALDGLKQILDVFRKVQKFLNPDLKLYGILATMVDNTIISREITNALNSNFEDDVFSTVISRRVEAVESTYNEKSLINTKNSVVGDEYKKVTKELLNRIEKEEE